METPIYDAAASRVFHDGGTGYLIADTSGSIEPAPGWAELAPAAAAAYLATVNNEIAQGVLDYEANALAHAAADANIKAAGQSAHGKLVALGLSSWEATVICGYDPDDDGDGPGDGDGDGNN